MRMILLSAMLMFQACSVDVDSVRTSPATCLHCGGGDDTGVPDVLLLSTPLDWGADPAAPPTDLTMTPPTTIDPSNLDIARFVGEASWDASDVLGVVRQLRCGSNSSWIGCEVERVSDEYFQWVCWVRLPNVNAYCSGSGEFENDYVTDSNGNNVVRRTIKRISGHCTAGTLRC